MQKPDGFRKQEKDQHAREGREEGGRALLRDVVYALLIT